MKSSDRINLNRKFSAGKSSINNDIPVTSASSSISSNFNTVSQKSYGFHNKFQSNFHNFFKTPFKEKNTKMLGFQDSPPTRKQQQLQEFTLKLKENKIDKYGKNFYLKFNRRNL